MPSNYVQIYLDYVSPDFGPSFWEGEFHIFTGDEVQAQRTFGLEFSLDELPVTSSQAQLEKNIISLVREKFTPQLTSDEDYEVDTEHPFEFVA